MDAKNWIKIEGRLMDINKAKRFVGVTLRKENAKWLIVTTPASANQVHLLGFCMVVCERFGGKLEASLYVYPKLHNLDGFLCNCCMKTT
jgi:hypothetical protein